MPLGTGGFLIMEGDLVKVTCHNNNKQVVPLGTIAPVSKIVPGINERYQLRGHEHAHLTCAEMELVSYVRAGKQRS